MDLTTPISDNLEKKGRQLYKDIINYQRLANIMEHPEFREFYDTYMNDWDTAKSIIMFMKLYEAIEKHSKLKLTPYQKIAVADEIFHNSDKRQQICNAIQEWCGNTRVAHILALADFHISTESNTS